MAVREVRMKMTKKIQINGVIIPNDYQEIYDYIGIDGSSPRKISGELTGTEDVIIEINSVGGDVWSGSAIYTMLKNYGAKVEVNIVGLAASAASVIAMAGDVVKMSPTGQMMLHNASGSPSGNKHDIKSALQQLESADEALLNAYKAKTGLPDETIAEIMDKTTWMSASSAKEQGFIDEIMFEEPSNLQMTASFTGLIAKDRIVDLKEMINKEKEETSHENEEVFLLAKTQLELLKIKSEEQ